MTEPNRQSGENEERIIEIEIERLRPFKEHPFQVKDDKEMFLLQESIEKQFYLMEHQVYRDQAQGIILDAYGKMVVEECEKFDEKTKQKIHDYIQQQVPPNPVERLKQDGNRMNY